MAETDKIVPRSRLLERTLELLRTRPRALTLDRIAADTGLTVAWLTYLMTKRNKEIGTAPSVDRVETLYEYLSKSTLEIR